MSRDVYSGNGQEAAVRMASSLFSHGMWYMNECMEGYIMFLKAMDQLTSPYLKIFYGDGAQTARETGLNALKVVIPIHEIKEVEYNTLPVLEHKSEVPLVRKI